MGERFGFEGVGLGVKVNELPSIASNEGCCTFRHMNLPEDFRVDTGRLAGCFNNTSATYKFYWLLAVLAEAEKGQEKIDKTSLFAHMVAHAWYTVNYKITAGSFC